MKRYISLILSVLMIISLCACSSKGSKGEGSSNTDAETTTSAPNQEQLNFDNLVGFDKWMTISEFDLSSKERIYISPVGGYNFVFNKDNTVTVSKQSQFDDVTADSVSRGSIKFTLPATDSSDAQKCSLDFKDSYYIHKVPVIEVDFYCGEDSEARHWYLIPYDCHAMISEQLPPHNGSIMVIQKCIIRDEYLEFD